jgi:hypothetical protein
MSEAIAITDDADLFSDPDFSRAIQERTKARAKAFFHGRGFDRLVDIANGVDDKAAMTAITTIGKLAGEFKAPKPVVLSFDELVKRAATVDAGPLAGITQIREAEIIDADDDDDDTTE